MTSRLVTTDEVLASRLPLSSQIITNSPRVHLGKRVDRRSLQLQPNQETNERSEGDAGTDRNENDDGRRAKVTEKNLKSIYANCLDLFQSKKINRNNSFTCKLLDCLGQIIGSSEFDISNMQMVGRTLEVGTKIYVCRVDYTYDMVMGLAQRIGATGKGMERIRQLAEQQRQVEQDAEDKDEEEDVEVGDNELDEHGEPLFPKERKAREKKKHSPGHFVATNDKISLVFANKSEVHSARQNRIKELFIKYKKNRQPIPHSEFTIRGKQPKEPERIENTEEQLKTKHKFPKALIKSDFNSRIKFLNFIWLPAHVQFDREVYDCWGRPKHGAGSVEDERRKLAEARRAAEKGTRTDYNPDEYEFDANAEVDYLEIEEPIGGSADPETNAMHQNASRLTDLGEIKNLGQLKNFYQALRLLVADRKKGFAWAGAKYLRKRGLPPSSRPGTATSKKPPRPKKEVHPVSFKNIDWKLQENTFRPVNQVKIQFDDAVLTRWTHLKYNNAYTGISNTPEERELDEEEFNEIFENEPSNDKHSVYRVLRYFTDRKRYVMGLGDELSQDRDGQSAEEYDGLDAPGVVEFDTAARAADGDDAYCSQTLLDHELSGELVRGEFPNTGNNELDDFLSFFPASTNTDHVFDEYEDFMGAAFDSWGVKFSKQPKPINMRLLKITISNILKEKLELNEKFESTRDGDMTVDMLTLIAEIFRRVDERTAKFLSSSLIFVALLHVIVDLKLFAEKATGAMENLTVIARPVGWQHQQHIPMTTCAEKIQAAKKARPLLARTPSSREEEKENLVDGDQGKSINILDDDDDDEDFIFQKK